MFEILIMYDRSFSAVIKILLIQFDFDFIEPWFEMKIWVVPSSLGFCGIVFDRISVESRSWMGIDARSIETSILARICSEWSFW